MKRTFNDLTKEEIAGILNTALDDGEWHTPSASDINIHTQHGRAIYGWCNISKHNTYHDKEVWFNINSNCVQIWQKEYRKGMIDLSKHMAIHNFKKLGDILESMKQE